MAIVSRSLKGDFVLFMVVACMVTSAMSMSGHVGAAVSEMALAMEGFQPCFDSLKGIEGCTVKILKAVFGLPLDSVCCQVVYQIADNCVPKEFNLTEVLLPVAIEKCLPCIPRNGVYCPDLKG